MRKVLFVDCCIRGAQSRTWALAEAFLEALPEDCQVEHLRLTEQALAPLTGEYFESRQTLLDAGQTDHPRFCYAHQFAEADLIVMAAPFWDLMFPALLKVYIEQVSVDGITFASTEQGLKGRCKASALVYLTTRGGFYPDGHWELGTKYLDALHEFFGIGSFFCVGADGMDVQGFDVEGSLAAAKAEARKLAASL